STELTGGAPAAPREFYADDRGGFLQDLSPDGTRALFVRENGDEDDVVFEVEVATGKATRIFPAEAAKAGAGAVYSAKGDRILVSTQSEGHASELLAFDRATRKLAARYEESALPTASIEDVSVARSGDALALEIDAGNHTELRLLDARSLKPLRPVTAPLGALTLGASSPDGKRFSLTISRPDAPSEIATLDLKTGAITPLRADERPGLASMPALKASIESVTATDGLKVPVNLYLPEQASGKLPTILLVHGGPSGSSEMRFNPDVRFFTALGYAIVEPNIRGSSGFGVAYQNADNKEKRGDALKDVETIHAWAAAQPWCDPSRTIIMGQSYGGYMTLLALARQPKLWRAGVDLSGMSDLRTMEKLEDQSIRVYDETEFGVLGKEDDLLFEWSPLKHVGDVVAPLFVYQGKNDPITPQNEADQMVKALRQRRVPVEYMLLDDEGHGIVRRANRAVFLARVARFLGDHAGPGATPGTPGAAGSSP
ncbi:MAG TPA: prolyl oligopeptidase family serine peptidase, partial [Polyangiaceae bacterium]